MKTTEETNYTQAHKFAQTEDWFPLDFVLICDQPKNQKFKKLRQIICYEKWTKNMAIHWIKLISSYEWIMMVDINLTKYYTIMINIMKWSIWHNEFTIHIQLEKSKQKNSTKK